MKEIFIGVMFLYLAVAFGITVFLLFRLLTDREYWK
jgi:hypothetical protein